MVAGQTLNGSFFKLEYSMDTDSFKHRKVLEEYSTIFMKQTIAVATACIIPKKGFN